MSIGTINMTVVFSREIVKTALLCNANSVILGHNYPSGSLTLSMQYLLITRKLTTVLPLMDIKVLDHIIVTNSEHYSMLTNGDLP